MAVKLLLTSILLSLSAALSAAQSPVQEVGDEKEPALRAELVSMVIAAQNMQGEFHRYRRSHGLFVDNKTLNEKLNADPVLKKEFVDLAMRMEQGDRTRAARLKEIVTTYGWPGKSLVGTEAAASAWLVVSHAIFDVPFQRLSIDQMKS